jgi:argininosuccinate synthase
MHVSTAFRSPAGPRHPRTRSTTTCGVAPPRADRSRTWQSLRRTTSSVSFDAGRPAAVNGERLGLVELLARAADLGRRHGVGIVDHVEDRIVGLKVRDLYEVPAAAIVLTAHRELEKLVCTSHQNQFKPELERQWAYLCYAGLWHEPLRADLDAYMESVNEFVTGEVTVKLFKGSVTPVARRSRYALYDRSLAGFGESGGEFSQQASPGFIELFSLQSRMAHRVRSSDSEGEEKP